MTTLISQKDISKYRPIAADIPADNIDPYIAEAEAVDFVVRGVKTSAVRTYLNKQPYANLLGIGKYDTFVHVDTRGVKARW